MGEAKRKAELLKRVLEESVDWGDRPIVLQIDLSTALSLAGTLQLALRHPEFVKLPSAASMRQLVIALRDQVPEEFPAIKEMISLGFHPRFDR